MKCIVLGCKAEAWEENNSIKCRKHQNICPRCKTKEADGDWKAGYCQTCQTEMLVSPKVLPLQEGTFTMTRSEMIVAGL